MSDDGLLFPALLTIAPVTKEGASHIHAHPKPDKLHIGFLLSLQMASAKMQLNPDATFSYFQLQSWVTNQK